MAGYRPTPAATVLLATLSLMTGALFGWTVPRMVDVAPLRPSLPAVMSDRPLGAPAPAPSGSGGYQLLHVENGGPLNGQPVRWDPCRPISYVVRPDGAPPGGQEALEWAIARIERLTGLSFVYTGTTTEGPRENRPAMDRKRYGDRWSPVLIAWTDPEEYAPMTGFAGLGGPSSVEGRGVGQRRYVSGSVLLNRNHLAQVEAWPRGRARERAIILHELGHLIGLDHVDDDTQLMSRRPGVTVFDFAAGDLRGVAALSGGPCFLDY